MTGGSGEGEEGYAPDSEVPLRGYAALALSYAAGTGLFALGMRKARRPLPPRVPPWDLALLGVATYKASRLLAKDKITSFVRAPFTRRQGTISASEVMDEPRGHGVRLAVGDLVACPFCVSAWVTGALVCAYAAAPSPTRLVASALGAVTISDWLQYAWSLTQEQAEG